MLNWYNSKVTLELNDLIESGCNPWAFEYPSYYQGEEKAAFEQKVLDHYRFRQIGQETPGRWLHYFRTRIKEIMPYYIQLYKSQELMESLDDPFGNVNVTETFEQTTTGEHQASSTSKDTGNIATTNAQLTTNETDNTRRFSNTPQGSIDNLDNYLTEATRENNNNSETVEGDTTASSENNGQTSNQGSETGTVKHTLTRKGNQGVNTYAHDMKELRETFLNIDMMIINELKDLFLMVY